MPTGAAAKQRTEPADETPYDPPATGKGHLAEVPAPTGQEDDEAAERRNLNEAMVELEWNGKVVGRLPKRRGRWTTDAAEFFEDEKFLSAIRELIGAQAWAEVKAMCPLVDDLEEFADYAGKVIQRECVP